MNAKKNKSILHSKPTVAPENPIGIEIAELIGVAFSGHVRDVATVCEVLPRVLPESGRPSNRNSCPAAPNCGAATADSEAETQSR
jgi:hypothetical protein